MRTSHRQIRKRILDAKSKITDEEFFSSRAYNGYLTDLAEAATKRYSGAALDLLLVHLRGLNDLDAFDETGEDDAVELDQLVFYIDHSVLLPYAGAGTASSSSPGSPSSLAAA